MRIQLISCLLCDVAISGSLIYYFRAALATLEPIQSVPSRTAIILQKLIVLSVNQGLLLWCVPHRFVLPVRADQEHGQLGNPPHSHSCMSFVIISSRR